MLPVVHRELLSTARRRGTYLTRLATAGCALLALAWMYLFSGLAGAPAARGKELFATLTIFAFVYSLFVGAWLTADCISAEKRESTLGLLFLTDLRGLDIILGKLASSSIASFYGLLAIVPLLALAILLGGVTLGDVGRVALLLTNTMFFSLAIGLFVSTISQNERKALFATLLVIFASTVLPVAVVGFCQEVLELKLSDEVCVLIVLPSPMVQNLFSPVGPGPSTFNSPVFVGFFTSVAVVHLEAWLFIWLASRWLPRVAHERPQSVRRENWLRRWRQWSCGAGELRLRFRRRLLDQNAFFWLAAREYRKPHHVWLTLGIMLAMWLGTAWKYPRFFEDLEVWILFAFIVHVLLKIWFTSEVCTRLHEDRQAGALELLLSTPLDVHDIARGQTAALRRQFLRPVLAVLALDFVLLVITWNARTFSSKTSTLEMIIAGMLVLPLDLFALKWVGMWRALTQPKLDRALLGTWFLVLAMPWAVFALLVSVIAYLQFIFGWYLSADSSNRFEETMIGLWAVLGVANSLIHGTRARRRFFAQFRNIAMTRFDGPALREKIPWRSAFANLFHHRPPVAATPRKNFLRRHPWWVGFAVVLFVAAGSLQFYRFNAQRKLAREIAAIQARGEPVSYDDLSRFVPLIAPENNAADKLAALFPQLTPLYQFNRAPTKINQGRLPARGRLPDEYRQWYVQAVAGNANVLQALREIAAFPQSQFAVNWRIFNSPMAAGFYAPPLQVWWRTLEFSALLNAQTLLDIDDGKPDAAVDAIALRFLLARWLGQETIVAPHASRLNVLSSGLENIERLANAGALPSAILGRLQTLLQEVETDLLDTTSLRRAIICERAALIETAHESAETLAAREARSRGSGPPTFESLVYQTLKITGRWETTIAARVHLQSEEIKLFDRPPAQRLARAMELEVEQSQLGSRVAGQNLQHPITQLISVQFSALARVRATRTALAIEQWRAASNRADATPEKLDELAPQFLEKIPADPYDEKPIRYARQKTGYVVYSVGQNKIDNHGQINWKRPRADEPAFIMDR